ncbi:MAG TPA: lmo0937 family membrane protein [Ktedonosporobacter sp.]|nr:lmo0937 family membrane protein [Ktedonosporobacter sp.]
MNQFLWGMVALLIVLWLIGFLMGFAGMVIHVLLVTAVVVAGIAVGRMVRGRRTGSGAYG